MEQHILDMIYNYPHTHKEKYVLNQNKVLKYCFIAKKRVSTFFNHDTVIQISFSDRINMRC